MSKSKRNFEENDWGSKKNDYYSRNKTNRDDHDFLEEEEEAKKIQMEKLKKLQEANLLESDEESVEETKAIKRISLYSSDEEENKEEKKSFGLLNDDNNSNKNLNQNSAKGKKNKKNLLGLGAKASEKSYAQEELAEFAQILKNIKINADELNENVLPIKQVLESDEDLKLVKTLDYFQLKKQAYSLYITYLSFYLYFKSIGKINDHHPVIKKMYFIKSIINSDKENKEKIFEKIDKTLELISQKRNLEGESVEDENEELENLDLEEENDDLELNEENELDLAEESEEEAEFDLDGENDSDLKAEDILDLNNDFDDVEEPLNKKSKSDKIKQNNKNKSDALLKNKRNQPDSLLDLDFNVVNKNNKNKKDNKFDDNKENIDKFVQENVDKLQAIKEKKEKLVEKAKLKSEREYEEKLEMGQRLANKNMLKSRGIYRKRKQYQGNAKLHNREKYMKKQKLRKNMVKEYEGKPDVYVGETTGIRRDLIRSVKIK